MFSEEIKGMLNDNSNDTRLLYIYSRTYRLKLSYLKVLNREFKIMGLKVQSIKSVDLTLDSLNVIDNDIDVLIITEVSKLKLEQAGQDKLILLVKRMYINNKKIVFTSDRVPDKLKNIDTRLINIFSLSKMIELKYN